MIPPYPRFALAWAFLGVSALMMGQGYEALLFEIAADARGAGLGSQIMADIDDDAHAAAANPCFLDTAKQGLITIDYVDYFAGMGVAQVNYQLHSTTT